jgi:phosphopantetheinyl transferase (holo-ACP synthase)
MSIGHDARGKPLIEPNERLAGQLALRRARTHLTLTDEADHALAMVVIEQQ